MVQQKAYFLYVQSWDQSSLNIKWKVYKNQSNLWWNNIICRVIYLHSLEQWWMKMLCKVHICCSFDFGIHSTNDTISLLVALLVNNYIPKRWRKELDKVETQIQYILSILFKENTTEIKKSEFLVILLVLLPCFYFWSISMQLLFLLINQLYGVLSR